MVKKTFFLLFSLMLFAGLTHAEDDPAVTEFKQASDGGDYRRAYELGGALLEAYPNDDIIRLQYTAAAFVVGEFQAVINKAPFMFDADLFDRIENMGFGIYDFYIWQNKISAMAALGNITGALSELKSAEKFEYRPALFLQILLLMHEGHDGEAQALQKKWIPSPYDGVFEGELVAKRIIPAMREPDHLERWLTTAASYDETMLLLSCVGFRDWLDGNKQRGLDRMKRAVREGNPGSAGIPHVLLGLCLPSDESLRTIIAPGLDDPRWQKQTACLTAYYKATADCNWTQVQHHLEQLISLSPQDIDYQAIRMIIQLVQGRFREAGKTADVALKNIPWDTNNVLCMRLYRPLIHLLLNEQSEYRTALAKLNAQEMEYSWKRAVDVLNDPSAFDTVALEFADDPDKLCLPLSIRALIAETDADYILAEKLWMRFVTEEPFFKFLEFYLADARLRIISPLAALQRMN